MTLLLRISAHFLVIIMDQLFGSFTVASRKTRKREAKTSSLMEQKKKKKRRGEGLLEPNVGERRCPSWCMDATVPNSMNTIAPCSWSTQLPLPRCPSFTFENQLSP